MKYKIILKTTVEYEIEETSMEAATDYAKEKAADYHFNWPTDWHVVTASCLDENLKEGK